ncbi:hypothetical protein BH09BAC3_BH09BAC3_10370 [soil metagenome]
MTSLIANDYANPEYVGSKFRKKRFKFFEEKVQLLQKPITIIDIGGTVKFWVNENYHKRDDVKITVVNLRNEEKGFDNIIVAQGDACDLSRFGDHSFDISFSNSLIEHLHTKENQAMMAMEAIRVGKYHFIQTPNRYFPIEPHFKFPFFQFLPDSFKIFLQTKTNLINGVKYDRDYAENIIREIRLLSKPEMKELFPKSDLYIEKFMGLSKSFVLHRFPKR